MAEVWLTDGVPSRRVLAFGLDLLAIAAIAAGLFGLILVVAALTLGFSLQLVPTLPLVAPLYHVLFLASPLSATPGQAALGLVVRRNADLGRPDALAAVVCVAGFYLTLALGAIWLAVALLTRRRRTLHDLVSGLVVVRRGRLAALSATGTP
jgi:uncharacterized RDD family membrane protein YckC